MNGAHVLVQSLVNEGVEIIFGISGGAALPIYDALAGEDFKNIRNVLTRHEQGAVHMADGYARASGKVGVCVSTSGPGATNLVTGIASARMDSVPVVAITGQAPTGVLGLDAFQEVDTIGITLPIVKHSFQIRDPEAIIPTVRRAFDIARSHESGPVLIDLPKDIAAATVKTCLPTRSVDCRSRSEPRFNSSVDAPKPASGAIKSDRRSVRRSAKHQRVFSNEKSKCDTTHARRIAECFLSAMDQRAVLAIDAGVCASLRDRLLAAGRSRLAMASVGFAVTGFAVPAAIGAKAAQPDRDVWAFTTHRDLQVSVKELATAQAHHFPIKIVILAEDSATRLMHFAPLARDGSRVASDGRLVPDYRRLAAAYGCLGTSVNVADELENQIEQVARVQDRCVVLDLRPVCEPCMDQFDRGQPSDRPPTARHERS